MSSVLKRTAAFKAHEKPVTGDIKMSFVGYDHLGWLKCDGRPLSTTEFNFLFNVIGYTFGGSDNNFNLPNTSGKVLGSANTTYPSGTDTGSVTHILTIDELPPHNHGNSTSTGQSTGNLEITANSSTGVIVQSDGLHTHTGTTDSAGSHTHTSNATGDTIGLATLGNINTPGSIDNDIGSNAEINTTDVAALTINSNGDHVHTFTTTEHSGHAHNITDPTHSHTLLSIGGGQAHNNMQPTLFIGNTFIYSGIPIYPGFPPNPASAWPFTVGLQPPMI